MMLICYSCLKPYQGKKQSFCCSPRCTWMIKKIYPDIKSRKFCLHIEAFKNSPTYKKTIKEYKEIEKLLKDGIKGQKRTARMFQTMTLTTN